MYNYISKLVKTLLSYLLLELSSYIKFSHIVGSHRLFFSAINCSGPLIGSYNGLGSFILLLLRKSLFKPKKILNIAYTAGNGFFNPLVYHIPTIIASGYWFSTNRFIRFFLPLLCVILFIIHPIGCQAFYYSWFWFIPMAVHLFSFQVVFLEALGTTFLAHAIGSILTLYWSPMAAEYWMGLLPIVIVERLLMALGITVFYYVAQGTIHIWNSYNHIFSLWVITAKKRLYIKN